MEAAVRLAYAGLHPARLAELVDAAGSPERLLRDLVAGRIAIAPAARRRITRADATIDRALAVCGARAFVARGRGAEAEAMWQRLGDVRPPVQALFVRGRPPGVPGVGIVGTRRATRYGRALATAMASALAREGIPVISGLARGIDGAAHEGALAAGGVTVAVLGCGIDRCYPAEHVELLRRILDADGAVLSEYPPGAPPLPWRFPPRNRIIAGLSVALVVVEAGVRGGALITARQAAEQGREVFAVPGDVDRPTSEGCNRLIRDGAHPVLGPDDLLEALSLIAADTPATRGVVGGPLAATAETDGTGSPIDETGRRLLDAIGPAGIGLAELAERSEAGPVGLARALGPLERAGLVTVEAGWVQRR